MKLKLTDRNGVFSVHRTEDEAAFAELHAPRAKGGRRWGIKYRGEGTEPFSSSSFNIGTPNKIMAMRELEWVAKHATAAQLCIE